MATNVNTPIPNSGNKYQQVISLINQGQANEALDACRQLLTQHPEDAYPLFLMGSIFFNLKKYSDAMEWFEKAVSLDPGNTEYSLLYGETLRLSSYPGKCEEVISQLLENDPNNDRALFSMGQLYASRQQWFKAIDNFNKVVELKPSNTQARLALSEMLLLTGQTETALIQAEKALSSEKRKPEIHCLLANIHQMMGHKEKSQKYLEKSIAISPEYAAAYTELVKTKKVNEQDMPLIRRMEKQLEKGMEASNRVNFHFALAKAYNDLKDYDQAFSHLHKGNLLLYGEFPLDDFRRKIKGIKKAYKSIDIGQLKDSGNPSTAPVFIVGMPRSGTTLIDQVLSSHSSVHSLGESMEIEFCSQDACEEADIEFTPYTLPQLDQALVKKYAQRYLDHALADAADAKRVVDKMPANFIKLGFILTLFPNARIIHSMRHPLDTALSCYFQHFRASVYMEWTNDLSMLGQYYRGYAELMAFWKKRFPGQILDVRYEDMTQDLENNARRIVEFVGLEWEEACLDFHKSKRVVQTASLWQVRQPIYKTSVARWRPYAKHLGPLVEALGDILTEEDYQALQEEGLDIKRPSNWLGRLFAR